MAEPAEASGTSREPSVEGCTLGNSAVTQLFVTAFDMGDEDRLGAIRSTVAALRKEEEEVNQRLKQKAVVQKLQDKVDLYMSDLRKAEDVVTAVQTEREAALKKSQDDQAALQQQLHNAQEEINALTTERNKLAAELTTKDIALSEYQATKVQLVEELVSYRAQTHEMGGTIAAYTEQQELLTSSLEQRNLSQQDAILRLNRELMFYRNEWARSARLPPPNMHGPVGRPCANYPQQFFQSYPPGISVGYDYDPVPTSGPVPGDSTLHPATDVEQVQAQSLNEHSNVAHSSGDSFHTAQASDDQMEAATASENMVESEPGLEQEFNLGHSLPEPEVELGPAFLTKLQNKVKVIIKAAAGVDKNTDIEATKEVAVPIGLGPAPSPPSHPPVQASRGSKAAGVDTAADVPVASDVSVAGEVSEVAPTPPARRAVYFTPLHPAQYASMPDSEQQTYKEAVERLARGDPRLARGDPPTSAAPSSMAGVHVTPMPPHAHTHSSQRQTAGSAEAKEGSSSMPSATVEHADMGEVKEQRPNRRRGSRGSGGAHATEQDNASAAAGQQTICLSQNRQEASKQGTEGVEVTARQLVSKSARRRIGSAT